MPGTRLTLQSNKCQKKAIIDKRKSDYYTSILLDPVSYHKLIKITFFPSKFHIHIWGHP